MLTQVGAESLIDGARCQLDGAQAEEHGRQRDGITHNDEARHVTKLRYGSVHQECEDQEGGRYKHQVRVDVQGDVLCFRIGYCFLKAHQRSYILDEGKI